MGASRVRQALATMSNVWATVFAAVLIAAAIFISNRYTIIDGHYQGMAPVLYRMDSWTGTMEVCVIDPDTMRNPNSVIGARFSCRVP
jgi:hypothetical protein